MNPPRPRVLVADNPGPFTLEGTRTYLVGRRQVAVIDPGPDSDSHVAAVAREVADAESVTLLVTHTHGDHDGATSALARATDARVLGYSAVADRELEHGESVATDGGELVALDAPGHSQQHLIFHWPDAQALFAGDLILGQGDTTWVGEYPDCVADYLASLDLVAGLELEVIHPAHGPDIDDPAETVKRFREHRLQRIREVEEARAANPHASARELVDIVYGDRVPPGLEPAAEKSVQAILEHLDAE